MGAGPGSQRVRRRWLQVEATEVAAVNAATLVNLGKGGDWFGGSWGTAAKYVVVAQGDCLA